jgi:hypothetical protein
MFLASGRMDVTLPRLRLGESLRVGLEEAADGFRGAVEGQFSFIENQFASVADDLEGL